MRGFSVDFVSKANPIHKLKRYSSTYPCNPSSFLSIILTDYDKMDPPNNSQRVSWSDGKRDLGLRANDEGKYNFIWWIVIITTHMYCQYFYWFRLTTLQLIMKHPCFEEKKMPVYGYYIDIVELYQTILHVNRHF